MNNWDEWRRQMRVAIQAAAIVRQCFDKMAEGRGAPDEDDMIRYAEEAEAVADLWDETLPKDP